MWKNVLYESILNGEKWRGKTVTHLVVEGIPSSPKLYPKQNLLVLLNHPH